jgi:hypothetical protein
MEVVGFSEKTNKQSCPKTYFVYNGPQDKFEKMSVLSWVWVEVLSRPQPSPLSHSEGLFRIPGHSSTLAWNPLFASSQDWRDSEDRNCITLYPLTVC